MAKKSQGRTLEGWGFCHDGLRVSCTRASVATQRCVDGGRNRRSDRREFWTCRTWLTVSCVVVNEVSGERGERPKLTRDLEQQSKPPSAGWQRVKAVHHKDAHIELLTLASIKREFRLGGNQGRGSEQTEEGVERPVLGTSSLRGTVRSTFDAARGL